MPTVHHMKLQPTYFHQITDGTKRIELRLNDEKRQLIKLGDHIIFANRDSLNEQVTVVVVGLHSYQSFDELLNDVPLEAVGAEDREVLLEILRSFYSEDEQRKYGALGIRVNLI